MNIRVIPRLDIKGPNLVKGIQFEGLRVLGKPEDFARYYYESGADELIYQDAVASLYKRNSLLDIIRRTARSIFIPLSVGGGLRTVEDIREVLRAGADKVVLNTAAVQDPELLTRASRRFGSSTILVAIEAFRHHDGRYEAYVNYGRDATGLDAVDWAVRAVELGAGELLVTCINREGAGLGFDTALMERVAKAVPVPVIAGGGAGKLEHLRQVIHEARVDAVAVASMLHYHVLLHHEALNSDFTTEGNTNFLQQRRGISTMEPTSLDEMKRYLVDGGCLCRPAI